MSVLPLVVVMPVYNEAACLKGVIGEWLDELSQVPGSLLLVVDDGSKDATPDILQNLARSNETLRVIRQENGGHGAAILTGYREALRLEPEWVFQTDSDRQIAAEHLAGFWQRRKEAAFLQGVRWQRDDPRARIWLSRAHQYLLRIVFGHAPRDPNIPFRLMQAGCLARLIDLLPPSPFAPNVMLSLAAQRAGSFSDDEPVPHRPRETGAQSIHGWKTLRIAVRCARELWQFRRQGYKEQTRISA